MLSPGSFSHRTRNHFLFLAVTDGFGRYWKEIEGINTIVVNDLDLSAVESIQRNLVRI